MKKIKFLINSNISHRGIYDNKRIIENTIDSFEKSINKKYAIELDLRLTKDNKIIVFHDEKLDRLSNRKGYIKDIDYREIKGISLINDNLIPTFDEVLNLVDGKVPLLIELKDIKGFKLEKEVIKKLDNYNGEFAIQSFRPSTIIYFRLFRNNYIRGLLIGNKSIISSIIIKFCNPDFINVNKKFLDNKVIKKYNGIKLAYMISKEEKDLYKDKCDNIVI